MGRCTDDCGCNGIMWIILILLLSGCLGGGCGCNNGCSTCG